MSGNATFSPLWDETLCTCCRKRLDSLSQWYRGSLWGHASNGNFFSSYAITVCGECRNKLDDERQRDELWARLNKEQVQA